MYFSSLPAAPGSFRDILRRMFAMIGHMTFGLIIGLLARAVMPGYHHMGLIMTMLLGLLGAWVGGLIGRMTGCTATAIRPGFSWLSWER